MESEKSALKRSFFGDYFFYKLRGIFGVAVASALLGGLACLLPGISFLSILKSYHEGTYSEPPTDIMLIGLMGLVLLAVITPIVAFRFYRSRNSMDILGCLPITYSQRFWGDFLSGLAAIVVPYSVMSAIGGILLAVAQKGIESNKDSPYFLEIIANTNGGLFMFGVNLYLIVMIIIVSTYALTTLVTSCCGKAGSAVLYSVIAIPIVPFIISQYGTFVLSFATGIEPSDSIDAILSCIPPAGTYWTLTSGLNFAYSGEYNFVILSNPVLVIIALVFTAAMIAAAYLIGRRRKAERVGNSFAVNTMYHALALLLVAAVIGIYMTMNKLLDLSVTKILIGVAVTLMFYLALELIQNRSVKTLWKSLIRYACVAAACFGFMIIAMNTECFDMGRRLPKQSDILEVDVSGGIFYDSYEGKGFTYRADEAIAAILSENQKLYDHTDRVFTGDKLGYHDNALNIVYKLKNGTTVNRYYRGDEEILSAASQQIKKQPIYSAAALGFLNDTSRDVTSVTYRTDFNSPTLLVRSSLYEELFDALRDDIINHFDEKHSYEDGDKGTITIMYTDDMGWTDYDSYTVQNGYAKTLEILNKNDIFLDSSDNADMTNKTFDIDYFANGSGSIDEEYLNSTLASVRVRFSSDSGSEYARELMSYFATEGEPDGEEQRIRITTYSNEGYNGLGYGSYVGETYFIPEDKEEAALKAMLNLIAEQAKNRY